MMQDRLDVWLLVSLDLTRCGTSFSVRTCNESFYTCFWHLWSLMRAAFL